jgi:hypothetical protein
MRSKPSPRGPNGSYDKPWFGVLSSDLDPRAQSSKIQDEVFNQGYQRARVNGVWVKKRL